MSTKIFNAYEWTHARGVHSLFPLLRNIRNVEMVHAIQAITDRIGRAALRKADIDWNAVESGVRQSLMSSLNDVLTPVGWLPNTSASAVVYVLRGRVFVQFFGMATAVPRSPHLRDFHYQNSTDRPAGVTSREWASRRRVWDAILPPYNIPSLAGLSFDFVAVRDVYDILDSLFEHEHGHTRYSYSSTCTLCQERRNFRESQKSSHAPGSEAPPESGQVASNLFEQPGVLPKTKNPVDPEGSLSA